MEYHAHAPQKFLGEAPRPHHAQGQVSAIKMEEGDGPSSSKAAETSVEQDATEGPMDDATFRWHQRLEIEAKAPPEAGQLPA